MLPGLVFIKRVGGIHGCSPADVAGCYQGGEAPGILLICGEPASADLSEYGRQLAVAEMCGGDAAAVFAYWSDGYLISDCLYDRKYQCGV